MRTTCTARSPMIITVVATCRARWRWRSRYPRVFFLAEFTSTTSRLLIAVLRNTANPYTNHARRCRLASDAEHLASIALAIALPVLASLPITFLRFLGILIYARLIILPHISSNVRRFRRHRRRIAAQVRHLPMERDPFRLDLSIRTAHFDLMLLVNVLARPSRSRSPYFDIVRLYLVRRIVYFLKHSTHQTDSSVNLNVHE